jgi:hypothetical protein
MVYQHTGVLSHPWMLGIVAPDDVIDGTGNVLFFLVQHIQARLNAVAVRYFQYVECL